MGKIDDMRRLREAQYAERERGAKQRATGSVGDAPSAAVPDAEVIEAEAVDAEPAPPRSSGRRGAAADEGTCSACGKVKPVQNGLIAVHQKGLGKVCTGSRRAPR
jgi:hypothetical protein